MRRLHSANEVLQVRGQQPCHSMWLGRFFSSSRVWRKMKTVVVWRTFDSLEICFLFSEHPNSSATHLLPAARKLALVKNAWSYFLETAATAHSRCGKLENGKQMCTVPASPCMLYPLLAVAGFNCQVLSSPFRQTAARSLMIPGMPSEHVVVEGSEILKFSVHL